MPLTLAIVAGGCAWSNPANRPVWNAFEAHVVPDGDAAFYATLPLTVPTGFAAILLDTVVVHPLQVVDDAAGDAADEWKGLDWRQHYYTELGLLPVRAAWTPCVFVGSWLGRICFDIPPHGSDMVAARNAEARTAEQARAAYHEFFAHLADGGCEPLRRQLERPTWDAELDQAFARALAQANAAGRVELFRSGRRAHMPPIQADPCLGLRDPDPVVRYLELLGLARDTKVPAELRDALLHDANEMVRLLAQRRWP
ncbi:MAG: hypothetical protein R3F56_09980 [Planctomycetota bacterium]